MNARIENILTGLAKQAELTLEFSTAEPIRLSGFRGEEASSFEFDPNQPNSELIFNILEKIGLVPVQENPIKMPWFVNRPYENERAGEIAYKTCRTIRQKFNPDWRAKIWAMCAFVQVASYSELNDFLIRHPRMWLLIPLVMYGMLKAMVIKIVTLPFRILAG